MTAFAFPEPASANAEPLRLCFVCNEYPPSQHGGIGTSVHVLARALVDAGHMVRIIGLYPVREPSAVDVDCGVTVHRLRASERRGAWVAARVELFRTVARWAAKHEINLVEVPDWGGMAAGWPRLPVPVIARLHGSARFFAAELGTRVPRRVAWMEAASLRRADAWTATTRYAASRTQALFRLPSKPLAIIPYLLADVMPVGLSPRRRCQVAFTGTLTAKKGIVSLIRAWPLVLAVRPNARLDVYGKDGTAPDGGSMQAYLTGLLPASAAGTVLFHGHVARHVLFDALGSARAAVFPSYAETFGIAPMEAMLRGCPTIYTRRGPGPELLRDGIDALLVNPDDPTEIAHAILSLLADDGLAARLAVQGRERVRREFATPALLARNETFFRACCREFGRGRQ